MRLVIKIIVCCLGMVRAKNDLHHSIKPRFPSYNCSEFVSYVVGIWKDDFLEMLRSYWLFVYATHLRENSVMGRVFYLRGR